MLTTEQVRTLARYSAWRDETIRDQGLEAVGRPGDDEIVESALAVAASPDRNLRVAALRLLARYGDRPDAAAAVLRATHDAVRRVKRIAVNQLPVDHPGAAERLREIAADESEYHRIRGEATMRLGREASLPDVQRLLRTDEWRRRILFMLVHRRPLDDDSKDVLREIVRIGDKDEAVVATRALCGQRVVNTGGRPPSDDAEPADVGWLISRGMLTKTKHSVYFWVRESRKPS